MIRMYEFVNTLCTMFVIFGQDGPMFLFSLLIARRNKGRRVLQF